MLVFPALIRMDSTPDQRRGPPLSRLAGSSSSPRPRGCGLPRKGQEGSGVQVCLQFNPHLC